MKLITSTSYITKESMELNLFYKRSSMKPGDNIKGYKTNKDLVNGLKSCNYIVADMYWKPIGDSFLFLSVLQAAQDYLKYIRPDNLPKWILDKKFSELLVHIDFLKDSEVVECGIDWYKKRYKNRDIVLITDEDPFRLGKYNPIFNSESYKYPKFVEISNSVKKIEYSSRPARYYLTFEREVGIVLKDPNNALPEFVMDFNEQISNRVNKKYNVQIDNDETKFIAIISQTSKVEKKYGSLRYLEIAKKILKKNENIYVFFFINKDEESPGEWLKFRKEINDKIKIADTEDLEETAYLLARCDFTIGNDTGFSHLAAMSKASKTNTLNPVIIIYSDHDYGKWSTGKSNVIPVATKLAEFLKKNNMSLRRDKIEDINIDKHKWAYNIKTDYIIKKVKELNLVRL